ncbi:hypothetical protein AALP_AA7G119800 [Arabis alpina]|uniref:Uncharacterized protein n=1 Tax=Arabis alpina TaxID=50452 RepID=A0A087GHH9_ARAAL|nr:hypothetical protein AALP_AA7G119800 [Arabis alpina]
MRGATPGIPAFTIPSIPICSKKSRRLSKVSNRSDAEVTAYPSAIVVITDSEDNTDDNTEGVSLPNREDTLAVKDGSQKIPSATNAADMQKADEPSAQGSAPDKLNEPNGPSDASRSKGKGNVDPIDKKAGKKRIAAKVKADLEAGRIPTFWIGGTCEVLPSEAPVAQSLGVISPASLLVNSDSAAIPLCPAVQTAANVSQTPPRRAPSLTLLPRLASELSSESSLSKRRRTTEVSSEIKVGAELIMKIGGIGVKLPANLEDLLVPDRFLDWSQNLLNIINSGSRLIGAYEAPVAEKEEKIKSLLTCTDVDATQRELDRQKACADSWEVSANANRQSADDYAAQVEVLKGEKHRLEDEVKKRDVHLEAVYAEIVRLRTNLEKSRLTRGSSQEGT